MHGIDCLVPLFFIRMQGTCIPVTPQPVANVLRVPRVEFLDYLGCERLRIVSKDDLKSTFSERPSKWGECQFTYCLAFAKGPQFLNMVMTFILYSLSHYNSITKPHVRFLLSLLEHLTINFPSHFILSIINVHLDLVSRDKLIFPSATRKHYTIFLSFFLCLTTSLIFVPQMPLP